MLLCVLFLNCRENRHCYVHVKRNYESLYYIRCLLELHRLKQAWTRMSDISRRMSLVNWSIHLKKPSPSWVWYVLGCIPHEISLTSFSSSNLTPINIWSHIVSHMGRLRRGPAVHQPPCSDTSVFLLIFQGLFYTKNLRSLSYLKGLCHQFIIILK
jgi:hypothetical protein